MAWGYAPRRISGAREASLHEKKKGLNVLLILVGICAAVFVFGLSTEILKSLETPDGDELLIKLDEEGGVTEGTAGEEVVTQEPPADYSFGKLRWTPKKSNKNSEQKNLTIYEKEQRVKKQEFLDGDSIR